MGKANSSKLSLEEQATKVCTKCGEEKSLDLFNNKKGGRLGRAARCKECVNAIHKEWRAKNTAYIRAHTKEYNAKNREVINLRQKEYRQKNPEKVKEQYKVWLSKPGKREVQKAKNKKWRKKNHRYIIQKNSRYIVQKKKTDPSFKLECTLRARQYHAIEGKQKTGSAVRDMGCTGQEACDHLESLFDENMTWENWGTYWHLDHIFPVNAANMEYRVEYLAVSNWRNLQPLEAKANIAKGDKVTPAARRLFNKLVKEFSQ